LKDYIEPVIDRIVKLSYDVESRISGSLSL
jgi:hypothetical protein